MRNSEVEARVEQADLPLAFLAVRCPQRMRAQPETRVPWPRLCWKPLQGCGLAPFGVSILAALLAAHAYVFLSAPRITNESLEVRNARCRSLLVQEAQCMRDLHWYTCTADDQLSCQDLRYSQSTCAGSFEGASQCTCTDMPSGEVGMDIFGGQEAAQYLLRAVVTGFIFLVTVRILRLPWIYLSWVGLQRRNCVGAAATASTFLGMPQKFVDWVTRVGSDPHFCDRRREAERLRVQSALTIIQHSDYIFCFILLPLKIWYLFAGGAFSSEFQSWMRIELCDNETLPLLVVALLHLGLDVFRRYVTPRTLDSASVLLSAMWAWKYLVLSRYSFEYNAGWMVVGRILLGIIYGNARLQSILHILVMVVDVMQYSMLRLPNYDSYKWRQMYICTLVLGLTWVFESITWKEVKRANRSVALVRGLLSGMCDAVCCLNGDLEIVEPCPQLASLLLRTGGVSKLLGQHLSDLMPPMDSRRFLDYLAWLAVAHTSSDEPAHALHLHLHDANNSKVPVEIFCSCISDADGHLSYLIGIKEDSESTLQNSVDLDEVAQRCLPRLVEGTGTEFTYDCGSSSRASSVSLSQSGSDDGSECDSNADSDADLWLDAATEGLNILSCSRSFAMLNGTYPVNGTLAQWMEGSRFDHFAQWLLASSARPAFAVRLQPPRLQGASFAAVCTKTGHLDRGLAVVSGADPRHVVLKHIRLRRRYRGGKSTVEVGPAPPTWMLEISLLRHQLPITCIPVCPSNSAGQLLKVGDSFRKWLHEPAVFEEAVLAVAADVVIGKRQLHLPVPLGRFCLQTPRQHGWQLRVLADILLVWCKAYPASDAEEEMGTQEVPTGKRVPRAAIDIPQGTAASDRACAAAKELKSRVNSTSTLPLRGTRAKSAEQVVGCLCLRNFQCAPVTPRGSLSAEASPTAAVGCTGKAAL